MRVCELLELPLLRGAGVDVVAGSEHLDREIRWVHSGEIADIAQYLTGGEVLLTAATGLSVDERALRRYIREIAQVGAAAVIIELGRRLDRIPSAMIEEAQRGALVLVALENEVPFVGVTHAIHTELINASHAAVLRALEIDDALGELIREGAPLAAVLELLSERLHNPVILEDSAHRVLAYGEASGIVGPILRDWRAHTRAPHREPPVPEVRMSEAELPCAWSDISLRGEMWGRLHVLERDSPLNAVARLVTGRAASTIALQLMLERDAWLSDEAEVGLLRTLTSGRDFNAREFLDHAGGLGIALGQELVVLATSPAPPAPHEAAVKDPAGTLLESTRAAFAAASWPAIVGALDGTVIAVAGTGVPGGHEAAAARVVDRLMAASSSTACIGVSRPCRASGLPRAFEEARAADRLSHPGSDVRVQLYDELVLHRLLSPLIGGPELSTFVEGELGGLIAYDDEHGSELVRTLDAFLQANGSKIATAGRLFLRRRSVYYRLEHIEEILGCSLDSPERRGRLYLALRARELLNDRGTRGGSDADRTSVRRAAPGS
ncbi:MAG: PucR family transcriptional regulator ligand-binding domain-containing protein [Solirubrobacteraceae bacterium]